MPFKDRLKQLRYMRWYSKEERQILKDCKAKQNLRENLTKKMIRFAREFIQERRNYPIEAIPNYKFGTRVDAMFMVDSEDSLKSAVQKLCKAEDDIIRNCSNIHTIGIIKDMHISLLDDEHGLVWERITPLTYKQLMHAREGILI